MTIPKIGQLNPAAVIREVSEKLPKLRTLVSVGIFEDGSADIWESETPDETERCLVILQAYLCNIWQGLKND